MRFEFLGANGPVEPASSKKAQNPGLTRPAGRFTVAAMLMNALQIDAGAVVVVVVDGHAAGTCRV